MANTFRCSVVTPDKAVFDDQVTYVSFPAWDGQQGVMAGGSPILTRLGVGPLRMDLADGGSRWYLLDGGFAQVGDNQLTLLTESAQPAEDVSISEASTEVAAASEAVRNATGDEREVAEHRQQLAFARKQVAESAGRR